MEVLKINELYNMGRRAGWANRQQNLGFLPVHFVRLSTENQYLHWFVWTTEKRINTFRHTLYICLLAKIQNLGKQPTEVYSNPNLILMQSMTSGKHLPRINPWAIHVSIQR